MYTQYCNYRWNIWNVNAQIMTSTNLPITWSTLKQPWRPTSFCITLMCNSIWRDVFAHTWDARTAEYDVLLTSLAVWHRLESVLTPRHTNHGQILGGSRENSPKIQWWCHSSWWLWSWGGLYFGSHGFLLVQAEDKSPLHTKYPCIRRSKCELNINLAFDQIWCENSSRLQHWRNK